MNILQKFDQVSQTPEYQNASDIERDNIRQSLFWDELAPRLSPDEVEATKADYDKATAPAGDPTSGTLEDVGRSFVGGAVSPVSDMARFFTGGSPNEVSRGIDEFTSGLLGGRSPTAIQSEKDTGLQFNQDTGNIEIKPDSSLYGLLMQVSGAGGSVISSVATGAGLGKGIGLAGKVLSTTEKAADVAIQAKNFDKAREALTSIVKNEQRANTIGFGMTGAAMVGGGTGAQAYDETLKRTGSVELAEQAGAEATVMGGVLGATTMGAAGPIEHRLLAGRGAESRLSNFLKGAGTEATQEFFESGGQEYLAGKAMRDIGLNEDDLVGRSLAVGVYGSALGAISGGALGGLSKPHKEYSQEDYDRAIASNNQEAQTLEGALNTGNLSDEQRAEHEQKLKELYRSIAIDEIAKGAAHSESPSDQTGTQSQAQSQGADVAEPGEGRIPASPQNWLPENIQEQYESSIKERREIISQLRRAAQNGIEADVLKQYEARIKAQDERININRLAVAHSGNQKYFATKHDFYGWLNRAAQGANWEQLAQMELEARKGRPVDWPALAQMEQNILQRGDIRDRARVLELNQIVKAVEQRMAKTRLNPHKGMEVVQRKGIEKLRKREEAELQRKQRRQEGVQRVEANEAGKLTPEQKHMKAIERRWRWERNAKNREESVRKKLEGERAFLSGLSKKAKAKRKKPIPQAPAPAPVQQPAKKADVSGKERLRLERKWRTPTKIGNYTVKAANNLYFEVHGPGSHYHDSALKKLGGQFHKGTGIWTFPRGKRKTVEHFLKTQTGLGTGAKSPYVKVKEVEPGKSKTSSVDTQHRFFKGGKAEGKDLSTIEKELLEKRSGFFEQQLDKDKEPDKGTYDGKEALRWPWVSRLSQSLSHHMDITHVVVDGDDYYFIAKNKKSGEKTPYYINRQNSPMAQALIERDGGLSSRSPIQQFSYTLRTSGQVFLTPKEKHHNAIARKVKQALEEPKPKGVQAAMKPEPKPVEEIKQEPKEDKSYPESEATHVWTPKGKEPQLVKPIGYGWYRRPDGSEPFLGDEKRRIKSFADMERDKQRQKEAAARAEENERKAKERERREEERAIKQAEKRRETRFKNQGINDDTLNRKLPVPGLGTDSDNVSGLSRVKDDGYLKLADRNGNILTDKELTSYLDNVEENGQHEYIPAKTKDSARITNKNLAYVEQVWNRDNKAWGEKKKAELALRSKDLQGTHYVAEGGGGFYLQKKPDLGNLSFDRFRISRSGALESVMVPNSMDADVAKAIRAITGERVVKWSGKYDSEMYDGNGVDKGELVIHLKRNSPELFLEKLGLSKPQEKPAPKPQEKPAPQASPYAGFAHYAVLADGNAVVAKHMMDFAKSGKEPTSNNIEQFIRDNDLGNNGQAFREAMDKSLGKETREEKKAKPSIKLHTPESIKPLKTEDVSIKPEKVSTSEEPVKKTEKPVHEESGSEASLPKPIRKGYERIDKLLGHSREVTEDTAVEALNEAYRLKKNADRLLSKGEITQEQYTEAIGTVDQLTRQASDFGYEIAGLHVGSKYTTGHNADVINYYETPNSPEYTHAEDVNTVIKVHRPEVKKNGNLVQRGQYDVATDTTTTKSVSSTKEQTNKAEEPVKESWRNTLAKTRGRAQQLGIPWKGKSHEELLKIVELQEKEDRERHELLDYLEAESRVIASIKESAQTIPFNYDGRSLVPLAKDMAKHFIKNRRRMTRDEMQGFADSHNVDVGTVDQLSRQGFAYDWVLAKAQRGDKDSQAFLKGEPKPAEKQPATKPPEQNLTEFDVKSAVENRLKIPYDTLVYVEGARPRRESGISDVIDYATRKMVVLDVKGIKVPFYRSTGKGGKIEVPPDHWYPCFGIHGPTGWINKGRSRDMARYYDSPVFKSISEELDRTLGDPVAVKVKLTGAHVNFINTDMKPIENVGNALKKLQPHINTVLETVEGKKEFAAKTTPEPTVRNLNEIEGGYQEIKDAVHQHLVAGERVKTPDNETYWLNLNSEKDRWVMNRQDRDGHVVRKSGISGRWTKDVAADKALAKMEYDIRTLAETRTSVDETTVTPAQKESRSVASPEKQPNTDIQLPPGITLNKFQIEEKQAGGHGLAGELDANTINSLVAMRDNPNVPSLEEITLKGGKKAYSGKNKVPWVDIGHGITIRGYKMGGTIRQEITLPNGMSMERVLTDKGTVYGGFGGNYEQIVEGKGFAEVEEAIAKFSASRRAPQAEPAPRLEQKEEAKQLPPEQEPAKPKESTRQARRRRRAGKLIEIDEELSKAADEFAAELKKGMGTVSSGVDPVMLAKFLQHGIKTSSLLIQKGAIKFADWADNMLAIMEDRGFEPEQIAPYLKRLYMATSVEDDIEHLADQMDDRKTVKNFDIDALVNAETAYTVDDLEPDFVESAMEAGRKVGSDLKPLWYDSEQGSAKVKTAIMDHLVHHGPEDMTPDDITDIGRVIGDRVATEQEVYQNIVSAGVNKYDPMHVDFTQKVLENQDEQNSRLALENLVNRVGQDFRTQFRDEGIESAKEKYKHWVNGVDRQGIVDRLMDYRKDWRQENTEENADASGSHSSNESLERVSSQKVSKTQGSRETGARGRNDSGQVLREDDEAGGSGIQSPGSQRNSTEGADLRGAGTRSEGELGERGGGVNSGGADFTITPDVAEDIAGGGKKTFSEVQRFEDNIAAIKLLKELGDRPATAEQQKVLARYVGWGGLQVAFPDESGKPGKGWEKRSKVLKELLTEDEYEAAFQSTPNAHYTTPPVVNAIYKALDRFGVSHGRVLEPSVGVGNFIGLMPEAMRGQSNIVAVEKDVISGMIAQKLYPSATIHTPQVFEKFDAADNSFDVLVANPPFGSIQMTDPKRKAISGWRIHNYFLAKSMDLLRPGGVMGVVVSKGFMDSSKNLKGLERMHRQAELIGAYRLPGDAFRANANTDVTTDILFFKKREEPLSDEQMKKTSGNDFRHIVETHGDDGSVVKVNQYFAKNNDHVLGDTITSETGMYGQGARMVVVSRKGLDWHEALDGHINKLAEGIYNPESNVTVDIKEETAMDVHNADVGGLYLDDDGNLMRRGSDQENAKTGTPATGYTNQQGKFIKFKDGDTKKIRKLLRLARVARELIQKQVQDYTDSDLQPLRDKLNKFYDAFVKAHNALNRDSNKRLISNSDPTTAPMLLALEAKYQKPVTKAIAKKTGQKVANEKATKADIFNRRTQSPYVPVEHVGTPQDALVAGLARSGVVHMGFMKHLLREKGLGHKEIYHALKGQIFYDPKDGYVTKDEYLSGNVKEKLRQAKELHEEAASHELGNIIGSDFSENIAALEKVIPKDIPPHDIAVRLGAVWQTPQLMQDFWKHLTGDNATSTVSFVPAINKWFFKGTTDRDDLLKEWSVPGIKLTEMLERTLNNKQIVIKYKDVVSGNMVVDKKATEAANIKTQEIQDAFSKWIWEDSERSQKFARIYNDMMNTTVNRKYDGSHLTFPGKISDDVIKFRETQSNAIWRIIQSKTTLLDHIVGAGKTFTMIGAAMEMRRMGLAKKPVFVVPNHLVEQWAADFAKLYPNSKVLAATSKNFSKHKRKQLFAQVATGDWDAVIVSHTSFGKLPSDPKEEERFLTQQLEDLGESLKVLREQEGAKARSTKQLASERDRMKQRLEKLKENTDKDAGLTLQDLGIDSLFVDEAHEFKNLAFQTSMDRVKNINPQGSNKATDLFIKIQSILRKTNGRNIIFATGTPISNSMAEMYTMQRYLGYQALKTAGLNHFDAWARQFGSIETKLERKPSGKYEPVSRFAKFINLPELMQQSLMFSDVINNDDIIRTLEKEGKKKHIPNIKGGGPQNTVADRSILQEGYMATIEHRFANMPDDPREDNPLKATNDARKAALDIRMIKPDLPDHPGSKINKLVDRSLDIYHQWKDDKGTQLIFSDLSTPKGKNRDKAISDFREQLGALITRKDGDVDEYARMARRIRETPADQLYDLLLDMSGDERVDQDKAMVLIEKTNPDEIESLSARFDAYNDIKAKLIANGVPEHEIAFIHDASTDAQKEELFAKVNNGTVRFLLGSTAKMGAGTNVQERLVALHHLDAPWRPSDLEQREGRIIRQGNELYLRDPENFEIEILRYATERTYDVNMWQTLETKANFIQQVRNGSTTQRTAEDVGSEAANAAEMKAASSGDPRILEQVDVQQRLTTLKNLREQFTRNRTSLLHDIEREQRSFEHNQKKLVSLENDQAKVEPLKKDKKGNPAPAYTDPSGNTFKTMKDAIAGITSVIDANQTGEQEVGSYRGFKVLAEVEKSEVIKEIKGKPTNVPITELTLWLEGEQDHSIFSGDLVREEKGVIDIPGVFTRMNNALDNRLSKEIETTKKKIETIPKRIEGYKEQRESPFKYEEEYRTKVRRNQELLEQLGSKESVNKPAMQLEPYQNLEAIRDQYGAHITGLIEEESLKALAMQRRVTDLMDTIKYSKKGTEHEAAHMAMKKAREQEIRGIRPSHVEKAYSAMRVNRKKGRGTAPVAGRTTKGYTLQEPVYHNKNKGKGKGISWETAHNIAVDFAGKLRKGRANVSVELFKSHEAYIEKYGQKWSDEYKQRFLQERNPAFVAPMSEGGRPAKWRVAGFPDVADSAADLRQSLRHETYAHVGLDTLPFQDKSKILQAVKAARNSKSLKKIYDDVANRYSDETEDVIAEEVIARVAERAPHLFNRILHKVKLLLQRALRKVGLLDDTVTHEDLVELLKTLEARVKRGEKPYFHDVDVESPVTAITDVEDNAFEPTFLRRARSGKETRGHTEQDSIKKVVSDLAKLDKEAVERFTANTKGGIRKAKGAALGLLGGRQIADIYSPLFKKFKDAGVLSSNPITGIANLMQGMQTLRNDWVNKAEKIDQRWARLARTDKRRYKAMADLMYDTTLTGIDPRLPYDNETDLEDYQRIEAKWNSLSPEAQQLYTDVEQHYKKQFKATQKAMIARAKGLFEPREAHAAIQRLEKQFGEVKGPYFPLMRFGDYYIKGVDAEGKEYREHFEKEGEYLAAKKQLIDQGMEITEDGKIEPYQGSDTAGVMPFVVKMEKRLIKDTDSQYSRQQKMKFLDELHQVALASLPETSAAKRSMHRRGIAGYDSNARRAFNSTVLTGSNRLARVTYGWQVEDTLKKMREATEGNAQSQALTEQENITAQNVITELKKRHELNMNPNTHPAAAFATNFAFLNYLGGSLGAGIVNLTQTPLLTLPVLGGRFGYRRTSRYMAKASADYLGKGKRSFADTTDFMTNAWFTLEGNQGISEDERALVQALIDDGTIETTQASTVAGNAGVDLDQPRAINRDWYNTAVRASGIFFHNAEVANRQISALASYRLWRDDLLKRKPQGYKLTKEDIAKGAAFARKTTFDTHFDYSSYNRPRYMKGNWARVFLIFKQYSQNMAYLLGRTFYNATKNKDLSPEERTIARRQMAGILGMSTLASGLMGLPGIALLKWFAEAVGGDDDDPYDAEVEFRKYLAELFGKDVAHALSKGVANGFLGIDLYSRVKLSDLFYSSDNRDLSARDEAVSALTTAAGPFFGHLINSYVGLQDVMTGGGWQGMERMMPKFVRDGMRAVRYSREGLTDSKGNVMIEDFSPWELAMRVGGIGSAKESEAWDARNAVKTYQAKISHRRTALLNSYDKAKRSNDPEAMQDVMEQIGGFNAARRINDQPHQMISGKTLTQSSKQRERRRRKTEKGIYLPSTQLGLRDLTTGYAY